MSWADVEEKEARKSASFIFFDYYPNGQLKRHRLLVGDAPHGSERTWHPDGSKKSERNYRHGKLHGRTIFFGAGEKIEEELWFDENRLVRKSRSK